jgi:serine protease Do
MINAPKISRSFLLFFTHLWALWAILPPALAQPSLIEQIQEKTQSIVAIQAQKPDPNAGTDNKAQVLEKTGAGIIIDPSGYIVTNTHTILYAEFIFATLHNGMRLPATIASIAPDSDFTILKVDPGFPLKPLPWSDAGAVSLGADIISIGNSPLWKQTICAGKITGIAKKISQEAVALIEMDLDLDRGDSGGPILDRQGNFLGIIIAKNTRAERSSYALPSAEIREYFLKYLNESHRPNE